MESHVHFDQERLGQKKRNKGVSGFPTDPIFSCRPYDFFLVFFPRFHQASHDTDSLCCDKV